jgi:hypothetical protein
MSESVTLAPTAGRRAGSRAPASSESPRRRSSAQQSRPGRRSKSAVQPDRDSACQAESELPVARVQVPASGRVAAAHRLLTGWHLAPLDTVTSHWGGWCGSGPALGRGRPGGPGVEGREQSSAQEALLRVGPAEPRPAQSEAWPGQGGGPSSDSSAQQGADANRAQQLPEPRQQPDQESHAGALHCPRSCWRAAESCWTYTSHLFVFLFRCRSDLQATPEVTRRDFTDSLQKNSCCLKICLFVIQSKIGTRSANEIWGQKGAFKPYPQAATVK